MKSKLLLTLLALVPTVLAGCAGAPSQPSNAAARRTIVVQGELTDNGLGCSALRGADGTLYTLARELEGTTKGEQIRVEGYVVPAEGCAVGVNVMPRRAVTLPATNARVASGLR